MCQPTFVADAVAGMLACLCRGRIGGSIAAVLGVRPLRWNLPRWVAMLGASGLEALALMHGGAPPLGRTAGWPCFQKIACFRGRRRTASWATGRSTTWRPACPSPWPGIANTDGCKSLAAKGWPCVDRGTRSGSCFPLGTCGKEAMRQVREHRMFARSAMTSRLPKWSPRSLAPPKWGLRSAQDDDGPGRWRASHPG